MPASEKAARVRQIEAAYAQEHEPLAGDDSVPSALKHLDMRRGAGNGHIPPRWPAAAYSNAMGAVHLCLGGMHSVCLLHAHHSPQACSCAAGEEVADVRVVRRGAEERGSDALLVLLAEVEGREGHGTGGWDVLWVLWTRWEGQEQG